MLPKGQRTLERFFGNTATSSAQGKKPLADEKSDSIKRKRDLKNAIADADNGQKGSIVIIDDSPPRKKLQTVPSARNVDFGSKSPSKKKTVKAVAPTTTNRTEYNEQNRSAGDSHRESGDRFDDEKPKTNQIIKSTKAQAVKAAAKQLMSVAELEIRSEGNVKKNTEQEQKSLRPALVHLYTNHTLNSYENAPRPDGPKTPEKTPAVSGDEDDLFDVATPEKKPQLVLPNVSTIPAAYKVARLKVTHFESNFSSGVNLIVANNVQPDDPLQRFVLLSGTWLTTRPEIDSEIFIFGMFRGNVGKVDSTCGFVVVYPQHLMSVTSVTAGLYCKRKALLNLKFKRIEDTNSNLIVGTVAHEVFQRAVSEKLQRSEIVAVLDEILARSEIVHDLYLLNLGHYEIKASVLQMVPHILSFMRDHFSPNSKSFQIEEIVDIEDNLLCPRLGVRGKVDLTVKLKSLNGHVPLELKTGKPTFGSDHMAQVFFYTAMLNEKSGKSPSDPERCSSGILSYIQRGNDSRLVKPNEYMLQSLMQQRNELATSWEKIQKPRVHSNGIEINAASLGEFKEDERSCSSCPCNTVCSIYAKMTDDLPADSVRRKIAHQTLAHLNEQHIEYMWHWLRLLDKERQKSVDRNPSAFWMIPLDKRVADGNCVKNLTIAVGPAGNCPETMSRSVLRLTGSIDLESTSISPNTYIAVSEQGNEARVANRMGFVQDIDSHSVTLSLTNDVGPGTPLNKQKTYCLDKVNSASTFNTSYSNLIRLLRPENERLRSLTIDCVPASYERDYPRKNVELCEEILHGLNDVQVRAVIKTLMSNDYLLLKGMPGTGKTTVIVATVRALVKLGQRVLVTSYTHNALDNILERLDNFGIDYVRIGTTTNKVVRANSAPILLANVSNVNQVKKFYSEKMVFGATCLGTNNVVFDREKFDFCIVDEASQVLQPACLGPVMCAKKFLLVGDPDQLSPVILSRAAKRFGMEECLFKRLQSGCPDASNLIELNRQYRMNCEIMALCSGLIYENKLVCGNDQVAKRTLKTSVTKENVNLKNWQRKCISENLCDAVVFLDFNKTNDHSSSATKGESKRDNVHEAHLIRNVINLLLERGISQSDIGVISTYQDQVSCLKDIVPQGVETSTVDRYQGKEKEIIIMSCVRSQSSATFESEIINDVRRINVAISRARSKLIFVGNRRVIEGYSSWKKLILLMRHDQFVKVDVSS